MAPPVLGVMNSIPRSTHQSQQRSQAICPFDEYCSGNLSVSSPVSTKIRARPMCCAGGSPLKSLANPLEHPPTKQLDTPCALL